VRLKDRVAIITGGASGIGKAAAECFVREGARVVIADLNPDGIEKTVAEIVSAGGRATGQVVDVSNREQTQMMARKVVEQQGRIDILLNNAGISQALYEVADTPVDVWRSVIDINLTGMFLCTKAALPLMERGATIVNTLSLTVKTAVPKFGAYNASKAGALGLTDTLRGELTPKGIRVMALIPGATDTAIWEQFWPEAPREKMVRAEDVAAAVVYAVTLPPEASLTELMLVPTVGLL